MAWRVRMRCERLVIQHMQMYNEKCAERNTDYKKYSESVNLHQAAILNSVKRRISCQSTSVRLPHLVEDILNHS